MGAYDGQVVVWQLPDLAELRRVELGPLLRNVTVDRERHEVLAASGCGIYAIPLE